MDPYEVLGVPRDADEETIKKAYRELIKKYHPDKYVNSPLADMASEKTKEINRAYDMINGKNVDAGAQQGGYDPFRGQGGAGGYNPFYGRYGQGGGRYTYNSGSDSYANVRALLTMNRVAEAEAMLNRLQKTAEWYFLMGVVCLRKGWYDQGVTYLRRAVEMEPNNIEYRNALDNITRRNTGYTTRTETTGTADPCAGGCPCWCIPCCMPCDCVPGCCCC